MDRINFDIYLDVHMVYGQTGIKEFRLHIGSSGDFVSSFKKLAPIIEPLLGEYFESVGFDPERYENSQIAYGVVSECIKKHAGTKPLIIPVLLEFYNGRGDGQLMRMTRKKARQKGIGFARV